MFELFTGFTSRLSTSNKSRIKNLNIRPYGKSWKNYEILYFWSLSYLLTWLFETRITPNLWKYVNLLKLVLRNRQFRGHCLATLSIMTEATATVITRKMTARDMTHLNIVLKFITIFQFLSINYRNSVKGLSSTACSYHLPWCNGDACRNPKSFMIEAPLNIPIWNPPGSIRCVNKYINVFVNTRNLG